MPKKLIEVVHESKAQKPELFYQPLDFTVCRVRAKEDAKIVIVNDLHIPFHDEPTIAAVENFMDDFKPELIVLNGDIVDFYNASVFSQNPSRRFNLQDELDQSIDWMRQLRGKHSEAQIIFLEGNHEDRLRRWLWKFGNELASLTSLELAKLLELESMNISSFPYRSQLSFNGFLIEHGHRAAKSAAFPANVSRLMAIERGTSGLCGHDHRAQLYSWTDTRGPHMYINNGCLCLLSLEYLPSPNWQHAFSYGVIKASKPQMQLTQIFPAGFRAEGQFYKINR